MIIKQIRLSNQAKEKLSRLKGKTGIKNWNILCRWAFCFSLHENTIPTDIPISSDSNVEMSWYTFAGEYSEIYDALILEWCIDKGIDITEENLVKYFKLHLERGISYLTGTNFIKNHEYTIEEKIVNLCDLMCPPGGRVYTIDKRLIDLIIRKGAYTNTQYHVKETYKLKDYFDNLLGYSLYDLFPEIKDNL